jgi:hypothetical protein
MGTLHEFPHLGADPKLDDGGSDVAFRFVLLVLWVCSAVRVGAAASGHEVFGAEASLAFVCMTAIPWLAVRSWLRRRRLPEGPHRPAVRRRSSPSRHLRVVAGSRSRG